jgi:hypothetical protein
MIVEIYEQPRTEEATEAEIEERQRLIEELGLKETVETKITIPFPELPESQQRVWEEVLPFKVDWDKYRGHIPTRVLALIKGWRDEFSQMYIQSDEHHDPILVGVADRSHFLLARWGDIAFTPFEELRAKAITLWKEKRRAAIEAKLSQLDNDTIKRFNGESTYDWL